MGKSLKNLHSTGSDKNQSSNQSNSTKSDVSQESIRNAQASVNRFSGMNEKQLMGEFMNRINNGSVTAEELERFYNQMSPHLTYEQRNRMRSLINMFKG